MTVEGHARGGLDVWLTRAKSRDGVISAESARDVDLPVQPQGVGSGALDAFQSRTSVANEMVVLSSGPTGRHAKTEAALDLLALLARTRHPPPSHPLSDSHHDRLAHPSRRSVCPCVPISPRHSPTADADAPLALPLSGWVTSCVHLWPSGDE